MTNNKAFVCFLVDGQSDIDTLKDPFDDLFDQIGGDSINIDFRYALFQEQKKGDVTSLKGVTPGNIEQMIYKYYFKQQDKNADLGWNDLTHIVHIIDIDGAYVKDERIREYTDEEERLAQEISTRGKPASTLYFEDHIAIGFTRQPNIIALSDMRERNKRKRKNIEYLRLLNELSAGRRQVKYDLYYFSSNLDHFLHGKANSSGPEKMVQAAQFSERVRDAESLIQYFKDNPYCEHDYNLSWKKIRNGSSSLQRGSNVGVLIDKIQESTLEDWL